MFYFLPSASFFVLIITFLLWGKQLKSSVSLLWRRMLRAWKQQVGRGNNSKQLACVSVAQQQSAGDSGFHFFTSSWFFGGNSVQPASLRRTLPFHLSYYVIMLLCLLLCFAGNKWGNFSICLGVGHKVFIVWQVAPVRTFKVVDIFLHGWKINGRLYKREKRPHFQESLKAETGAHHPNIPIFASATHLIAALLFCALSLLKKWINVWTREL